MVFHRTIALIDDDPDDHEIFAMAVAEASASTACIHFDSAETAFSELLKISDALPDYIFLDMNMPKMNGIQFLELVKKEQTLARIPIIVYSTSILPSTRVQALNYGAFDFLAKPSSHFELIKALKNILSQ